MANPYAHVLRQMHGLLRTEDSMGPVERAPFSWFLRADFCGTHVTVIKGGANTIIIDLGGDRGDPLYPEAALEVMRELAGQPYHVYEVSRGERTRSYHFLRDALALDPRPGMTITGVTDEGSRLTHDARNNVAGDPAWIARKR